MWGEHGRGFRSELGPQVFGETLYSVMRTIKTLFDPLNQLNPKNCYPARLKRRISPVKSPLKGHFDREITDDFDRTSRWHFLVMGMALVLIINTTK